MGKGFDAGMSNSQVFNPPSVHLPFLSHFRLSYHTLKQSIFTVTFDSHTLGLHLCHHVTTYTQDSHKPRTLPPRMTTCSKPHLPRSPSRLVFRRWSVAKQCSTLAVSPWSIDESELRFEGTARRNCSMVLREQCVNRMEGKWFTFVDSWKTYVFWTNDEHPTSITCWSYSRGRKEHTSVCLNCIGSFKVIYRAY